MQRGTLKGWASTIGDYNPLPTGGASPFSSRGRVSVDQVRLWGYPDNVGIFPGNRPYGAARLINTNAQVKVNNILFSGDVGTAVNVGNGSWTLQTGFPPWEVAYNVAGEWNFAPFATAPGNMWGLVTNAVIQNVPGVASTIPFLATASNATTFQANGAAVTCNNGADFSSTPNLAIANGGTMTAGTLTSFQAGGGMNSGVTMTTRNGVLVNQFNLNSGSLTNQFGVNIAGMTGASATNVPLTIGQSAQTWTAAQPSTGTGYDSCQIGVWAGGLTLNFANAVIGDPIFNFSPTVTLAQSGNALGTFSTGAIDCQPTWKNANGVTANITQTVVGRAATVLQADGATITTGTHFGWRFAPSWNVINSGVISSSAWVGIDNTQAVVGAGCTVSSITDMRIGDITNSGTVTAHYGLDINLLTVGTTANPIRINGVSTTVTATPPGAQIDLWPATTTLNFSNATLSGALVNFQGTVQVAQSAGVLGLSGGLFNISATFKNSTTVVANMAAVVGYRCAPTFQADGASVSVNATLPTIMFTAQPITGVINAGTLSSATFIGYRSSLTVGASTTVTSMTHFNVNSSAPTGTLTTELGLDINAMNGATPIAIRIAANTNPLQMSMTTTGPTTGNLTSNTNVVMTMYHGATNYYWLVAFNDGGTVRYKYLQLNGTGVTWVTGTTLPT